jgi:arylsulfatase A-like enzyme
VSHTSRRSFIRRAALGSAALALGSRLYGQPAKLPRKPNLLVFLPDQLRADTITGAAAQAVHAPNLHALASQSVAFECAYVTQAVCVPSRASLLTGSWPHQTGCTSNKGVLPPKYQCLPEMLADGDYRTGYFGKWHLGDECFAQHGFQEWSSIMDYAKSAAGSGKAECISDYSKFLLAKGYKPQEQKDEYFRKKFVATLPFELSKPKFLENRAVEFLERHRNEPFILFVSFFEPHPPYSGPFNNEHALDAIVLDASARDQLGEDVPLRYRLIRERQRKFAGTPAKLLEIKRNYFGLINEIDRCIGTILRKLDQLGLVEHTITVLTSDHGDMMGAHGLVGKKTMYEESARIPYLVRLPGQRPWSCSQPISHIDFSPTMLDLLGKPASSQCSGRSRAKLLRGEGVPAEPVFLQWARSASQATAEKGKARKKSIEDSEAARHASHESTRAIVSPDGWKLCLRDADKNELYNLRDDLAERHNLFYEGSKADVISRLSGEIHRWQEGVGDTLKLQL